MAKKKKKGLFKKLFEGVKKGVHAVVKIGKKVVDTGAILVLAPFKKAMQHSLRSKGITPEKKMSKLAPQFVEHIIKSKHYEGQLHHLECYEYLENLDDVNKLTSAEISKAFAQDHLDMLDQLDADNIDVAKTAGDTAKSINPVVGSVISAIINFFKSLKEKKQRGEKLSEAEEKALQLADEGAKQADELIEKEAKQKVGGFIMDKKWILIIVGSLAVVFVGGKLLKKKK